MKVITPLWELQQEAVDFSVGKHQVALFMHMGTGKTLTAFSLMERWNSKKVLIICPKTVGGIWKEQLKQHTIDFGSVVLVTDGTKNKRLKKLDENPDIVIINYESAWRKEIYKQLRALKFDTIVVDESHRIKGGKAKSSKAIGLLKSNNRIIMTGTFTPNSRLDIFGQFRFLNPDVFGKSEYYFKNRY